MKTHKDLDIWKRGIELVTEVYKLTRNFPKEETYGLSSLSELETQVIISKNLGYASDIDNLLNEIEILRKMTLNFIKHLKRGNE